MMKASNQSNGQSTKELKELNERISELETAEAELARIVASLRESKDQYGHSSKACMEDSPRPRLSATSRESRITIDY